VAPDPDAAKMHRQAYPECATAFATAVDCCHSLSVRHGQMTSGAGVAVNNHGSWLHCTR
jgi:hypothetical protein